MGEVFAIDGEHFLDYTFKTTDDRSAEKEEKLRYHESAIAFHAL